ncbi:hypothetical protein [Sphingobium sp. B12D2B]|uniref:hypothetical protein n=1 Tax=Sphingobium sp. B12D2B TaxID=2940577 RepID=UPI002224048C|nr:hypothetical protein [Sphingobium sp. B12D2B]MCW2350625.1 hypothetical protein [Sphingobium sp. B12D2B]
MIARTALLGIGLLAGTASGAWAADCPTGLFMADAGPDAASALEIDPDGRFRYMFTAGAVDESAAGRWECRDDGTLRLTTEPTPKPAAFSLADVASDGNEPFTLLVTWPNGVGVPAVDFELTLEDGDTIADYTQSDGWTGDLGKRRPRSIQVSEVFFGTKSEVIPLPAQEHLRVHIILTPNDMGVAAFRDTLVTREDDKLVLHWRDGTMRYAPAAQD